MAQVSRDNLHVRFEHQAVVCTRNLDDVEFGNQILPPQGRAHVLVDIGDQTCPIQGHRALIRPRLVAT